MTQPASRPMLVLIITLDFCIASDMDHGNHAVTFSSMAKRTNQCIESYTVAEKLIHLPTHEGLVSHFNQLEKLWLAVTTEKINKTIVEVPFQSHHFDDAKDISLCDIFSLPPEIQCSCESELYMGSIQTYCPMLGLRKSWATHPHSYGLTENQTCITTEVDLSKLDCVAGMVNALHNSSRYGHILNNNPLHLELPVVFTAYYRKLARNILRLLGLRAEGGNRENQAVAYAYRAVHWRRGDQLTTRCKSQTPGYSDTSVNCLSVQDFVDAVRANDTHVPLRTYIATNEQDPRALDALHQAGYLTSANITSALAHHGVRLSPEDVFVVELIFMCRASAFLYWGSSAVPALVHRCRHALGKLTLRGYMINF